MSVLSLSAPAREQALRAIDKHKLPDGFIQAVEEFYLSLTKDLVESTTNDVSFIGIQGSQGSGKSTCAEFIALLAEHQFDKKVLVMSIDDFYLTQAERLKMASEVHPLFATRGVPGTHDVELLESVLVSARSGRSFKVPRFDKSIDDRAPETSWQQIGSKVDIVILEGWCVGLTPEQDSSLAMPVNELERIEDADAVWRATVNTALNERYARLFSELDLMIALQAPSFDCVFDWRMLQEQKMIARLQATGQDTSGAQSPEQIRRFISHFQRLTLHALETMPPRVDYLLTLNPDHSYDELHIK